MFLREKEYGVRCGIREMTSFSNDLGEVGQRPNQPIL